MTIQQALQLGLQYHQAGRLGEAETLYRQILAVQPDHAGALYYLGGLAHQVGRNDLAAEMIQRVASLKPHDPTPLFDLGQIYRALGRRTDAIASYRGALRLKPNYAEAYNELGIVLEEEGRRDESIDAFRSAIRVNTSNPEAHNNLGIVLVKHGQPDEAIASYRRALELSPQYAQAHNNLGVALVRQGALDRAISSFRRALQINPDYAEAHNNLGNALQDDHPDEAIASFRHVLRIQPGYGLAYFNLGNALYNEGRFPEAATAFERALELDPSIADARFSLSLLRLLSGDYEHAWPVYEARNDVYRSVQRNFSQPRWDGTPSAGKRLLIHAEQGLGDSIQFVRYARLAAERGVHVILACQPGLVELFREVKGVGEVVAVGESLPAFDFHVPMLSQPLIFQTTLESIPLELPYLFAELTKREAWRERISQSQGSLKVGLVWSGSQDWLLLRKRHINLDKLLPLLEVEGVDFFSLQIGPGAEEIQHVPAAARIIDHTEHIQDFADTAALVQELDLVITVDTAVAHLAGSLGHPVWTLLPFVADWRWGLSGEETPWYPTMRLFRQPSRGDWETVVHRVATELRVLAVKTTSTAADKKPSSP